MLTMTSAERIRAAINHQEPDRVPFDLGATFSSGIHITAYQALREHLGLPSGSGGFFCIDEQISEIQEDLKVRLKVDTESVMPGGPSNWALSIEEHGDHSYFTNEWQIGLKMPRSGFYFDMVAFPLEHATLADLEDFAWPDPSDPARYTGLEERVAQAAATGRAVVMNSICAGTMEMAAWMTGYERLFSSMLLEPDFAGALLDKVLEIKLAYWERVLDRVGDQIDIVCDSDDLGEQQRPLISPRLYRKMLKARHKALYDFIHARTNAKIYLHSCGAIRPLIPDLIEIGVDILNPVQVNAPGMDPLGLKRDFGREIVFWGGAIDPQGIFGRGTPEQVRDAVRRNVETLMTGGGFVCATVHNIQPNVPPENVMAMWKALQEYGVYS
jgi:uroporphyrinogen decarboxylase